MTYKVTVFLFIYSFCMLISTNADLLELDINPEWERPDAWSRHKNRIAKESDDEPHTEVPRISCSETEDGCNKHLDLLEIRKMFYNRLAKTLFNERKFKESDSGFLIRTIQLKVERDRLQLINELIGDDESGKLTDLDEHIMTVLRQSEGGLVQVVKEEIFSSFESFYFTVTKFIGKVLENKLTKLLLYAVTFISVALLLQKRWGCNLLFAILFLMFVIGYSFQYLQCNNKKDMEQLIKFLEKGDSSTTPCDGVDLSGKTWDIFSWKKNDCINYMRKTANIEPEFCLPHHVLFEFLGDLGGNIFEKYFTSTTQAFFKATESFGIVGQCFAFLILMTTFIVFGKVVLEVIITSIFKYGFTGIFNRNGRRDSDTTSKNQRKAVLDDELTIRLTKTLEESQKITRLVLETHAINRGSPTPLNRIEDVKDGTDELEIEEFEHVELCDESEEKINESPKTTHDSIETDDTKETEIDVRSS